MFNFEKESRQIIDIKLGFSTMDVNTCNRVKKRPELFAKLASNKAALALMSDEEREEKSLTKFRFHTIRDRTTLIDSLGFRVDGYSDPHGNIHKTAFPEGQLTVSQAQRTLNDIFFYSEHP